MLKRIQVGNFQPLSVHSYVFWLILFRSNECVLDLDVVHDSYEPVSLSFFDNIFGFFTGIRQRGIQTTEEILRDGNIITAIGQIELDGSDLKLQESAVGPMFLTTATKSLLIRRLEQARNRTAFKVLICGTIAGILMAMIIRKIYLRRKREQNRRKLQELQKVVEDEDVVVTFKIQKRSVNIFSKIYIFNIFVTNLIRIIALILIHPQIVGDSLAASILYKEKMLPVRLLSQ